MNRIVNFLLYLKSHKSYSILLLLAVLGSIGSWESLSSINDMIVRFCQKPWRLSAEVITLIIDFFVILCTFQLWSFVMLSYKNKIDRAKIFNAAFYTLFAALFLSFAFTHFVHSLTYNHINLVQENRLKKDEQGLKWHAPVY